MEDLIGTISGLLNMIQKLEQNVNKQRLLQQLFVTCYLVLAKIFTFISKNLDQKEKESMPTHAFI